MIEFVMPRKSIAFPLGKQGPVVPVPTLHEETSVNLRLTHEAW
ncbi:hypothetical protein HMPREF1136_0875 [Actinomyces sp. ICM47]|nr:hypothetical protein HMPREF1136_0875 [Actinomyces sp. ICM47]